MKVDFFSRRIQELCQASYITQVEKEGKWILYIPD